MKGQKKDHLNIMMNDWEQRLIAVNNRVAKSYAINDQSHSGEETMHLGWLCGALRGETTVIHAQEPKHMDAFGMYHFR